MGGGSLHWSVSEPPASGGAPPDWWTIEAQTVLGEWGISVIESGESYVILNTAADRTNTPLYPAAAAYLNAWWVQHPDRTRPAERPSLIGQQGSPRGHVDSSRPPVAHGGIPK